MCTVVAVLVGAILLVVQYVTRISTADLEWHREIGYRGRDKIKGLGRSFQDRIAKELLEKCSKFQLILAYTV